MSQVKCPPLASFDPLVQGTVSHGYTTAYPMDLHACLFWEMARVYFGQLYVGRAPKGL